MMKLRVSKELTSHIILMLSVIMPTFTDGKIHARKALATLSLPAIESIATYSRTVISGIYIMAYAVDVISCNSEKRPSIMDMSTTQNLVSSHTDSENIKDPILDLQPSHIWVKSAGMENLDYLPDSLK